MKKYFYSMKYFKIATKQKDKKRKTKFLIKKLK